MSSTNPASTSARRLRFAFGALRRTVFAWILGAWGLAASVWVVLGWYDLALSQLMPSDTSAKLPRAYQVVAMVSGWLASWQFWFIGGLVLAFAAAVEYGVRAEQRLERQAAAKRKAIASARSALPPDAPIARLAAFSEALSTGLLKVLTESPKPKPPSLPLPPDPEPEWDKLYGTTEDGKDLRLRFLPDEEDVEGHTLLLVLYGYKLRFGLDRVAMSRAVTEACRAMREAPNANWRGRSMSFIEAVRLLEPEKYGKGAIDRGEVERVSLSKGGEFETTWQGVARADALARDLIRRA